MNQSEDLSNIAITGWVGVGSSTLTLLLANLLGYKYYPATQIFRIVNKALQVEGEKALTQEFEQLVQPIIGKTIDSYTDYKLMNDSGIILESDMAAFRLGKHPKVYSIFLKADLEERVKRFATDGRTGNETDVKKRDEGLREEYIKLWDIDIFDEELINKKYNIVVDTTDVDLETELMMIISDMSNRVRFKKQIDSDILIKQGIKDVKNILKPGGKDKLLKKLQKSKLVASTQEMMLEIVQLFPEDVQSYPEQIQKLFLGQD